MTDLPSLARETRSALPNPLGLEGIEFVEYRSGRPQALGQVLEAMGFAPVARHRSREVLLYRQGGMNVVINAHGAAPDEPVQIAALGLRVRDAAQAFARCCERGAWAVPAQVAVMELNIPAIHGVGTTRIYFVDRWREFSIWGVDFVPIPTVEQQPPALAGLHWFGVVQYIGAGRMADWCAFYRELFGFDQLPDEQRFGILPKGRILSSPCGTFHLQLIEPEAEDGEAAGLAGSPPDGDECLQRMGLGTPDVAAAMQALTARGVGFVDQADLHPDARGALTRPWLGGVMFELVRSQPVRG